jgi:hypothetical protein
MTMIHDNRVVQKSERTYLQSSKGKTVTEGGLPNEAVQLIEGSVAKFDPETVIH